MQNILNSDKLIDLKQFESFPTYIDYKKIFTEIALKRMTKAEERQLYRELCKNDLYFLLRYAMDRPDLNHPYLYEFTQIVQSHDTNVLYLCARGHYKSTVVTFAKTIQRILNEPNDVHCIFSVTDTVANPFLRQISNELRENSFLRYLFPEIIPEPNSDLLGMEKLTVLRQCRKKEATVESSGVITKMPTGRHYDHVIYDDLVTPETAVDPDILMSTYGRYQMSLNCVATNYTHIVIGTPYHYEDTYQHIRKDREFKQIIRPAEVNGQPVFMSRKELDRKREIMGLYVYNSQMLLDPTPSDQAFFDNSKVLSKEEADRIIPFEYRKDIKTMVILDPSISKKKTSDWCVCMAIRSFKYNELLYLEVLEYYSIREGNKNPTNILNILIDLCLKYNVQKPTIETIQYQEALVYRFHEICKERSLNMFVDEYKPSTNKEVRIKGLDPIINFGRLIIRPGMDVLMEEIQRFPHGTDDHLDCVSICLTKTPMIKTDNKPLNNIDRTERGDYNSVRVVNNNINYKRTFYNGQKPQWQRRSW